MDIQKDNSYIQRSSKGSEAQLSEHVKPFLAQISLLIYNRDGNVDFLKENDFYYYNRMKKYLLYWLENPNNYKGLAFWDSAPHTGMDNQHDRAGYWHSSFGCGVDLNCYLVRECKAFVLLAELFGKMEDATYFQKHADRLKNTILSLMWDENDRFFYDIDKRTGEKLPMRYLGAFASLWANVATEAMAKDMIKRYLMNPNEFHRGFLYPVMSAANPGYTERYLPGDLGCNWRANTWIPTNYYVFQSLRKYGYVEEAVELAQVTFDTVKRIGDREYYATESQKGCGLDPFWGWSLLAYFISWENENGYDPTEISLKNNDHNLLLL